MKEFFFFFIVFLFGVNNIAAQKKNAVLKGNIIYSLHQDLRKNKVRIGFMSKSDSAKNLISKKVKKNEKHAYIKFASDIYYLNVDSLPFLSNDICEQLNEIKIDTTVVYGEPLVRAVSVVLVIDRNGKIETYGIARSSGSNYYDEATLKILQSYNNNGYCKPAKVSNIAVGSLLRMSFSFGHSKCIVINN